MTMTGEERRTHAGAAMTWSASSMDEALVAEAFEASYRRLVTQLYAVTGDRAEAEDAVQEAFARAVAAGRKWRRVSNREAWLRTVAVNHARTRARRRKLFQRARPRISTPAESPGVSDDHVAVVEAMRHLGEAHRMVLALHYFADLSVAEIAAELGLPTGTVKTRLMRGREALQQHLRADEPAEPAAEEARHDRP
jgi:RNA polymerase sigma-70 factor (ECF subfamily)